MIDAGTSKVIGHISVIMVLIVSVPLLPLLIPVQEVPAETLL
jgi:hypothetical protein